MQDYNPDKDLLIERVILVTGAGSGIGQAAAKKFAEYGATVVLLGRNEHRLEQTYDQIEAGRMAPHRRLYPSTWRRHRPRTITPWARASIRSSVNYMACSTMLPNLHS